MGKEDEGFVHAPLASRMREHIAARPAEALTWYTPVRFDPELIRKLLDQHDALDTRVAELPNRFRRDREEAARGAQACAGQLHEVRRQEALWVYPVIARGLDNNPDARRQLLSLRFVMNGLARRVLRGLEELTQAVRQIKDISAPVSAVARSFAEYRRRNESELYTLYGLMDPHLLTADATIGSPARK
jgi:hypothetical protein